MSISVRRLQLLVLLAAAWLIYWGASWNTRVQLDAMIYGGLAKVIVQTGEWAKLHYTTHFFPEFYEHPPLVIWLAALLFNWIPATDLTQKILPFLAGLATLLGVVFWGYRYRSSTWAFVAGVVLLSSTRFIKYSSSLMLDPFLTVFLLWSVIFATLALEKPSPTSKASLWAGLSGLCASAAFLSKGMPALAGWAVTLGSMVLLFFERSRRTHAFKSLIAYVSALCAPFFLWEILGDGFHYLSEYWSRSVSRRLGSPRIEDYFLVFKHLIKVYWPWLPFALWGLLRFLRAQIPFRFQNSAYDPTTLVTLMLIGLLFGFSASGHFLEHYSVPLYPFLAILAADAITPLIQRFEKRITQSLTLLTLLYALILSTLPISIRGTGTPNHLRILLESAATHCSSIEVQSLQISPRVDTQWMGIALGRWYTPWNIIHAYAQDPLARQSELLIDLDDASPSSSDWKTTTLTSGNLRLYRKGEECDPTYP